MTCVSLFLLSLLPWSILGILPFLSWMNGLPAACSALPASAADRAGFLTQRNGHVTSLDVLLCCHLPGLLELVMLWHLPGFRILQCLYAWAVHYLPAPPDTGSYIYSSAQKNIGEQLNDWMCGDSCSQYVAEANTKLIFPSWENHPHPGWSLHNEFMSHLITSGDLNSESWAHSETDITANHHM